MNKRKTMLLAAAALSVLAFTALPSMAAAFETTPAVNLAVYPTSFSGETEEAGTLYTAAGRNVTCQETASSGSFSDAHTGSVTITFGTECRESTLNSLCTTAGQAAGTITTKTLPFHTIYLPSTDDKNNPHETPAVVFTPEQESGEFAAFSCVGGFVKIVVDGNGVIGRVTEPGIGESSNSFTIDVSATAEGQEYTETYENETFGLEARTNGGEPEPAYEDAGPQAASFAEEAEAETATATE